MKIIHCADLHLDAKMNFLSDREKSRSRRAELLTTFCRMVDYADQHQVQAILIAGDLFDVNKISATARNTVYSGIKRHPGIHFYYLRGNHDPYNLLDAGEELPANLILFGPEWISCTCGNICISAIELTAENAGGMYSSLSLKPERFNIVMLHGQEGSAAGGGSEIRIDRNRLKNRGIDYLALGHLHSYQRGTLDARGIWCYPGCLEGRGFDECGTHGFVLLDINEKTGTFTDTFVPFASRTIHTVLADVTGNHTSPEMIHTADAALKSANCEAKDLVRLVLTGAVDAEAEKDLSLIRNYFEERYYCFRLADETVPGITAQDYMLDASLKGEFVRLVMADGSLTEEDKGRVIRFGLQALAGEKDL